MGVGGHETEHVLQQRADNGMHPVMLECLPVRLGTNAPEHGSWGSVGTKRSMSCSSGRTTGCTRSCSNASQSVWATNAPELLVCQRSWTPERYEHFLAETWRRLLLAG